MPSIGNAPLRAALCLLTLGVLQTGCQKGESVQGNSPRDVLATPGAAREDTTYVRRLAEASPGGALKLDLSDDTQYRFFRSRLAVSGKTPEKSPQFFAMVEGLRQKHLAQKKEGRALQALEGSATREQLIGDFTVLPDGRTFEVTAFSTVQDGADYSFLDVTLWSESQGTQLSNYGWSESYGDGRKLAAHATGLLPEDSDGIFYADSVGIISVDGVDSPVYVAHNVIGLETLGTTGASSLGPGANIIHPSDTNADGIVTICLDRDYGDCDYPLVGKWEMQIPLKGTLTFPFDVENIITGPNTAVTLVEESGGARRMAFGNFASYLTINPLNRRQVSWDVPQHQGIFSGLLFQRYEHVDFLLGIDVNMKRQTPSGLMLMQAAVKIGSVSTLSSDGMPVVPKIQSVYSCLAEGTEIRLAEGKTARVEDITKGTEVLTHGSGLALKVVDTSVGIERLPMVRLVDDVGHDLLLTESHPVVTPDRGVLWAQELKVGDRVITESGVRTLVKAGRERFAGKVHNLKLDTSAVAKPEFAKGSAMFANGFRVGDLAMQRALEFKDREAPTASLLARLPSRWHADYLNSPRR